MKRALSEAKAWRSLAEALDAYPRRLQLGLCSALGYSGEFATLGVAENNREAMEKRLDTHYWLGDAAWIGPSGDGVARVVFCLFMALEAEDELSGA